MKLESELKLQSYLDGELSPRQGRKVAAWLAGDAAAQSLFAELSMTRAALQGNEPEAALPEGREFYWSKIQRAIESAEPVPARPSSDFVAAWRRLLAPLAGVALVAFLTVYTFRMYEGGEDTKHHLAVVENLSEHTGAYSFRSQSQNMFVVWVYDRSEEAEGDSEAADEMVEQ